MTSGDTPKSQLKSDQLAKSNTLGPLDRGRFSLPVLRIAEKLAQRQRRPRANVLVPHRVAMAHSELLSATAVAKDVLKHASARAREKLIGKLGGSAPIEGTLADGQKKSFGLSSLSLMSIALHGPIAGLSCSEGAQEDFTIVRAAFQLDAENGYRDARLTQKAARFVQSRRDTITAFDERLKSPDGAVRDRLAANGRPVDARFTSGRPDLSGASYGGGFDASGGGYGAGDWGVPLFPPDSDLPEPPEQPPGGGFDPCSYLPDLCLDLYVSFAAAALADSDAQLIASVVPDCVCHDGYTDKTKFTAYPDPDATFPPRQPEYRLVFRGDDITDRIIKWSNTEITFTIPGGSHSGFVYLYRSINSPHYGMGRMLANLCGVPDIGAAGGLSPSPRAQIAIAYPPVVEAFTIDNRVDAVFTIEACRSVRLSWGVRTEDQELGDLLPPCVTIEVEVCDVEENVLHRSMEPIGHWYDNTADDCTYHLRVRTLRAPRPSRSVRLPRRSPVESVAVVCGITTSNTITVGRRQLIHIEAFEPGSPEIVAGKSGTLRIRLSCPAPDEGALVALDSSDQNIAFLPNTVLVLPGETSSLVSFGTRQEQFGQVTFSAQLAGHEDGQLQYEVVQFLTAIALSGGGTKGSFEMGALLYLREVWNDIKPTIICGTSVGAVNAVALAETTDSGSIDKLERIWLALRTHSDMYGPTPELLSALTNLEIDYEAFVNLVNERGDINFSGWNLVNEEATAGAAIGGFLLGGPWGAILAGSVTAGIDIADTLSELKDVLENASSIFTLEPLRDQLVREVDPVLVANSGIKLRLAVAALEDGHRYYVTEDTQLMRDRAHDPYLVEPITDGDALVRAVLASAAMPGFFPAVQINTLTSTQTFVDGGARELLPSQAAVELGAQLIFSISASPVAPVAQEGFDKKGSLVKIAYRAIDLALTEIAEGEMAPRSEFCDGRERILIAPSIVVHSTTEIDPGLIRINMAYGFMKAFDRDQLRRGRINVLQYLLWDAVTDEIIGARVYCHRTETLIARRGIFSNPDAEAWMRGIRERKNRIAELMEERFDWFGVDAFPHIMSDPMLGNQTALDWAGTWEMHLEPERSWLAGIDLWTPQILWAGTIGEDGPGSPPVRESNVAARYPLPAAMIAALQHR